MKPTFYHVAVSNVKVVTEGKVSLGKLCVLIMMFLSYLVNTLFAIGALQILLLWQ